MISVPEVSDWVVRTASGCGLQAFVQWSCDLRSNRAKVHSSTSWTAMVARVTWPHWSMKSWSDVSCPWPIPKALSIQCHFEACFTQLAYLQQIPPLPELIPYTSANFVILSYDEKTKHGKQFHDMVSGSCWVQCLQCEPYEIMNCLLGEIWHICSTKFWMEVTLIAQK